MPRKYHRRRRRTKYGQPSTRYRGSGPAFDRRARTVMTKGVSLIPDRYMCKLKYSESYAFPGVASLETFELRGNSINDPNLTGSGHQPLGHTELASLYNKYRVPDRDWET